MKEDQDRVWAGVMQQIEPVLNPFHITFCQIKEQGDGSTLMDGERVTALSKSTVPTFYL